MSFQRHAPGDDVAHAWTSMDSKPARWNARHFNLSVDACSRRIAIFGRAPFVTSGEDVVPRRQT